MMICLCIMIVKLLMQCISVSFWKTSLVPGTSSGRPLLTPLSNARTLGRLRRASDGACMVEEIEPSPRPAQFDRNPGLTPPHEVHKTGLVLEGMQTTERGLPAEEPWTESC